MDNTVKKHGYLVRGEDSPFLEFYEKIPRRDGNHWTYHYSCFMMVLRLEMMPTLKWENTPMEVELCASLKSKEDKEYPFEETDNVIRKKGYLVRSEGYNHLEFYEEMPIRVHGSHISHWTYDEPCFTHIFPIEFMPTLKWEDEPMEVTLTIAIKKL